MVATASLSVAFMLVDNYCTPISGAACAAWRGFSWETVLAGSLGLAGGLLVITATRWQIRAQKEAEINRQLHKVEVLYKQLADGCDELERHVKIFRKSYRDQRDWTPNNNKQDLEKKKRYLGDANLSYLISDDLDLPNKLRRLAVNAHNGLNPMLRTTYPDDPAAGPVTTFETLESHIADCRKRLAELWEEKEEYKTYLRDR
ncbi:MULTISPECIES: hypothetical protein [unclassified Thalassospira]|uniref:hypothetical protein n=1 Tax=unclassified Thalassospira TaxID=2648997 RepID=UPI0007A9CF21|nr:MULTISPECIES: hypothetical protein [unclassified Thalassospira]KZC98120.1 hypothetical protein AUQ41_17895 [Thalassospira sp. MCCC 1A02898]ONH88344.1 hypothetical protein TH47_08525 [Thalassospira sp. MCCC 1A02803]